MNRNEWIKSFENDKRIVFNMALDFFGRYNNRNKSKIIDYIRDKYDNAKEGTTPTESEFNLFTNNKYFQKYYNFITAPSRYEVGDLVTTKTYSLLVKKRIRVVALVIEKRLDPHWGWVYDLDALTDRSNFYNDSCIYAVEQKRLLPTEGRNLNKVVK
jgi:hypothetical protein